jgi:hypothetical protein
MRGITLKIIYPLCMFAASFKKNRKEDYQRFVINLNNRLVKREKPKTKKILANKNRLNLSIATGGSLARRIISDVRPDAVVAVACENDLSSGIADSYPLPVLGIPNKRPFGPCMNTSVDLQKVKEAITFFGENPHQESPLQ